MGGGVRLLYGTLILSAAVAVGLFAALWYICYALSLLLTLPT
jgi:hypothetical protein